MAVSRRIDFPSESRLHARLAGAGFSQAREAPLHDPRLTPLEIAAAVFAATPPWVEALVQVRNALVAPLGLKPAGRLAAPSPAPPAVGRALSIFRVESADDREAVVFLGDRHVDVRMAFLKREAAGRPTYAVLTIVEIHNALGRLYMRPVGPFHQLLVRRAMEGLRL